MNQLKRRIRSVALLSILATGIGMQASAQTTYGCPGIIAPPAVTYASSTVSFPCAPSTAPTSSFSTIYQKKENYIPDNTKTEALYVDKVIKMRITVLSELSGGKKNYNASDLAFINSIVDKANSYLAGNPAPSDPVWIDGRDPHVHDTRFRLEQVGPVIFRNDVDMQYEHVEGGTSLNAYPELFIDQENVLNVFIMYAYGNAIPGGEAYNCPTVLDASDNLLRGDNSRVPHIVLKNFFKSGIGLENAANYLLHELGHTMGLNHIYAKDFHTPRTPESNDESYYDYLKDVFNVGTAKICYRPDDNAVYPTPLFYDAANPATANDEYTNNFMGGHPYGHYYSPMQIGRMHRNAHFLNCRKYIYNQWPEDENHDGLGQGQIHPLLVSNNQTWDFDIKMYSDIRVQAGATLTIKCRVLMPYHSNIIVEPGAKLVVDGGIITADRTYDNYFWYGITVLGDITKSQDMVGAQGIAEIKKNATIEHALHGVVAGDEIHKDNNKCGGILRISDANFINNKNAIGIWKFENKAVWPAGVHKPNRSYIRTSLFELNDNYHYDNGAHPRRKPQAQIIIWDVDGFKIEGCNISNKMSVAKRSRISSTGGVGVYSYEGSFTLANYCPTAASGPCTPATLIPSKVSGFAFGIRGEAVVSKPFTAVNTTFDKNLYGVLTEGVSSQQIRFNTFNQEDPAGGISPAGPKGVYAYGSNAYSIEGNSFNSLKAGYPRGEGVRIEESATDNNKVNNNSFYRMNIASLSLGMHTNGTSTIDEELNRGLSFLCNTYSQCMADIYVRGKDQYLDGIKSNQGTANKPAGNQFSNWLSSTMGRHMVMYQTGSGTSTIDQVRPVDAYYYSGTTGLYQQPTKYTTGRVNPIELPYPNECALPSEGGVSNDLIGSVGSSTSYASMAAALGDSSEGRNSLIVAAYQGMHSPYADAELSLYHIGQGQVAQGQALYGSIATNYSLNSKEQYEFAMGASLINLLAAHRQSGIAMNSLSQADIDILHYITANAATWPRAKACAWLHFATDEDCDMAVVEPLEADSSQQRRSYNSLGYGAGDALQIHPNPSRDQYRISYSLGQPAELWVSDLNGRTIWRSSLSPDQKEQTIDARNWQTGVYLYKVMQGNQTLYYGKLLKY